MGYDTHVVLGMLHDPKPEYKEDLAHPFDDGSGYHFLKDENGERVLTGRVLQYLEVYASLDLCHIYDSHLERLVRKHKKEINKGNTVTYFYGPDGNLRIKEDPYGELLVPVPLPEVLEAVRKDTNEYRRFRWLKGLLESLEDESDVTCVFYGT